MTESAWQPDRRQWWLLGMALLLVSLPHLVAMPWSLVVVWMLLAGARVAYGVRGLGRVPRWLRFPLALLIAILVFHQYGPRFTREAATALLVMMAALKFLELSRPRDALVLVFVGHFLLAAAFLQSQSLLMGIYLIPTFLILLMAWLSLGHPSGQCRCRALFREAWRLSLRALPLATVLFLLFPRLPAPLWNLPENEPRHRTGLGDSMEPGAISELALSMAPVARIRFPDGLPPPEQRYFRGVVLEITDGKRWERMHDSGTACREAAACLRLDGPFVRQEILLEAQPGSRILPALEFPVTLPDQTTLERDLTLRARRPLDKARLYRILSRPHARISRLSDTERLLNRLVPQSLSERVRRLARDFQERGGSPQGVIDAALAYFRTQPFHYTLRPPRLDDREDPVDAFLFETRRGFCEHYASAFTLLMRAAGLPARVITGYQGGEVNPVGGYLILRRADAHAWSEVWIEGSGWVRVDPTAAVAPERIERPLDPERLFGTEAAFLGDPDQPIARLLRRLRNGWDLVDATWTRTLIGFDRHRQVAFFSRLGLEGLTWQLLATLAVLLLVPVAGVVSLILLRRWRRERPDPAVELYDRFRDRCRAAGIAVSENEGPSTLLGKVREQQPGFLPAAENFVQAYVRLRYDRTPPPEEYERLLATMRHHLRLMRAR